MKTTISYKTTNILIKKLEKQNNIESLKKPNFLFSLFSKKKYADVYFHTGNLDEKSIENIKNSKLTIVNSFGTMNQVITKTKVSHEKVKVIYPSINVKSLNISELKNDFFKKFDIDFSYKILFFTAKNFKTSGIKEFLDICNSLNATDYKIVIAGSKNQIGNLKFTLPKYQKLESKIILLEDYKNIDEIFYISDIFILPTYNKSFSSNILKAMYCECAVFLSLENDAKEVIDVFSSMDSPTDASTAFKIDAILLDEEELNKIKIQNKQIAVETTLEANLQKINSFL